MTSLVRNAPAKPILGTALLNSRARSKGRRDAEDKIMQTAKRRDTHIGCRNPGCKYRSKKLPIDPCHLRHRGMGGNPKGDRTTTDALMSLCRACHGLYDDHQIDWQPQTDRGADGPVDWLKPNPETGRMEVFASETTIGVSVAVGL